MSYANFQCARCSYETFTRKGGPNKECLYKRCDNVVCPCVGRPDERCFSLRNVGVREVRLQEVMSVRNYRMRSFLLPDVNLKNFRVLNLRLRPNVSLQDVYVRKVCLQDLRMRDVNAQVLFLQEVIVQHVRVVDVRPYDVSVHNTFLRVFFKPDVRAESLGAAFVCMRYPCGGCLY